jgi:HAMP domain-containing protein
VFVLSLLGGVGGFYLLLRNEAMEDAEKEARSLMAFALAVGDYTEGHVMPRLSAHGGGEFFEEMVPFYSSRTVFRTVSGKARQYSFRQPTINPTSPEDAPTAFEMTVIRRFRDNPSLAEATGVQDDPQGKLFYLAQPVRISDEACLTCHSTPERAPVAMVAKYGPLRGFGWKFGEVVGAQILTVPLSQQLRGVIGLVGLLAAGLLVVFAIAYLALSLALDRLLIRPLDVLASAADLASRSAASEPQLPESGVREIRELRDAISRLRLSLMKALHDLQTPDTPDKSAP